VRTARSWLFVPGDDARKLAKAPGAEADALILDLEDSVARPRLPAARGLVAEFLGAHQESAEAWVRINALGSGEALADLAAVVPARPAGIVLPKAEGAADIVRLGHYLEALEAAAGASPGATRIAAIATETPAALFALGTYLAAGPRLAALTWGAEDLAAGLGAFANRDAAGGYDPPYQLARSLCLAGAAAAGVAAVDTVFTDFRNASGLLAEAAAARRMGFAGKLAIHPAQVGQINAAFTPSAAEIAWAEGVVAAFAAAPEAGVVSRDGTMLDRPHLRRAERILALTSAADRPEGPDSR
jgi:citrate lyase subunit beta/citryl-CoA lyase